jgi:hypothetical protein
VRTTSGASQLKDLVAVLKPQLSALKRKPL